MALCLDAGHSWKHPSHRRNTTDTFLEIGSDKSFRYDIQMGYICKEQNQDKETDR